MVRRATTRIWLTLRLVAQGDTTRAWLPAVCLLTLLVGGFGALIVRSQEQSRAELEERYALRVALSSRFVSSYVAELHAREWAHASELLSDPVVSPARFGLVSRAFGFDVSVLLDSEGRVLNIVPAKPELIGQRLDGKYEHLRSAVRGSAAVSNVVPSAARAEAIVAFAEPFDTPSGRRVFSGGVPIRKSPLAAFLANALPFEGAHAYLIDGVGKMIVAGGPEAEPIAPMLATQDPRGTVTVAGREYRVAAQPVAETAWSLFTLAPREQLFASPSGPKRWLPWLVLGAFALASAAALALLGKLLRRKAELAHLAAHDPLTGTINRRALERAFSRLTSDPLASEGRVGILLIDLDNFSEVNESYGYAAGDELLCRVAETLRVTVRPSDVVARIGGDKFAVLLAGVDDDRAHEIGERIAATLDDVLFPLVDAIEVRARCSVGVALAEVEDPIGRVLARADSALYEAKSFRRKGLHTATA